MDTYYLVSYIHKRKTGSEQYDGEELDMTYHFANVILKNIHPLKWICRDDPYFIYWILWWKRIPKEIATDLDVTSYIGASYGLEDRPCTS